MKRSVVTSTAIAVLLAAALPAGAAITSQLSRGELADAAETLVTESAPSTSEATTTTTTAPPTTEAPVTTQIPEASTTTRSAEPPPTVPSTTEPKPAPDSTVPDLREPNFRLECAARSADGKPVVVCKWTGPPVDGVRGYRVLRGVPNGELKPIGTTVEPAFADTDVAPGQKLLYGVQAFDAAGQMVGRSNLVIVAIPVPQTVVRLACSPQLIETKRGVLCEWGALDNPAAKLDQLWRSVDGGERQLLVTVGPDGRRRYFDTDVKPGQTIVYKVLVLDGNGNPVGYSEIMKVALPAEPEPTSSTTTAPTITRL